MSAYVTPVIAMVMPRVPSTYVSMTAPTTALAEVNLTPDGVGSTFTFMGRMFLLSFVFPVEWTLTRDE